ncbi:hypothetical protein QYF61_011048 [Mycteria americana]|uniref:Uncharacterized protein n=1 Tax=Mycteria americana TaxID=33587 RepID=A0AAN7NI59_MYCAM|nr:hypothetical protein QYF61_011048 [Mycteria americana]
MHSLSLIHEAGHLVTEGDQSYKPIRLSLLSVVLLLLSIRWEVLQPLDHLRGPPLDPLEQVHVFLMLGALELDAVLQRSFQEDLLHDLAGHRESLTQERIKGIWIIDDISMQSYAVQSSQALEESTGNESLQRQEKFSKVHQKEKVSLQTVLSCEAASSPDRADCARGSVSTAWARRQLRKASRCTSARYQRVPSGLWLGQGLPHAAREQHTKRKQHFEKHSKNIKMFDIKAKQPQFPQPLLIRLVLQTLHQLRCPSLDTLQHLNVSLVVGGPKLNTVFEVRPHQCRVQGHNHFPTPAGHAIFDTSQDAIGFLGHLGTLLAHIQAAVNQHAQVLLCLAAFQPLFPKPVALHGVAVTQVQDLALGLVKPHTTDLGPSIQPVQVPLQSLPTLQLINSPTQLGVICKLTEGALDPFIQIIDKDIKQNWPQHRALGNTACDRPPTGVNSIHHHSLGPAIQPVLYPAKSTPVQAMSSQFLQENAVGNRVKGFTEV